MLKQNGTFVDWYFLISVTFLGLFLSISLQFGKACFPVLATTSIRVCHRHEGGTKSAVVFWLVLHVGQDPRFPADL